MGSLFDESHTVQSYEPENYKGKLLIIRSEVLKEEYRTPENQLFFAISGSGCEPYSDDRTVFGSFLNGETTHLQRSDLIGIIADEYIPNWAKERAEQLVSETEKQKTAPKNSINFNM